MKQHADSQPEDKAPEKAKAHRKGGEGEWAGKIHGAAELS